MEVRFIGQPFSAYPTSHQILTEAMAVAQELTAVVAWAKRSGLSRLQGELTAFRAGGGTSRLAVGIDEGGATRQGLELALQLFDQVFVFHDIAGRTFHPKFYLFENNETATVMLGSSNMTAGGLYFNYEANFVLELDLAEVSDRELRDLMRAYVQGLIDDAGACIQLSPLILQQLIEQRKYQIQDEDTRRKYPPGGLIDSDSSMDVGSTSLFTTGTAQKHPIPPGLRHGAGPPVAPPAPPPGPPPPPAPPGPPPAFPDIEMRWYKRMSASDAQHPPNANSAPTGNLKLTQAHHQIDHTTYFRDEFFVTGAWQNVGGNRERAEIPIDIVVEGGPLGAYDLVLDHDPGRVANQGNVPTWLHWGHDILRLLEERNYTGCFVVIDRLTNGRFRLEITSDRPGIVAG